MEELLADAYAGMNVWDAGATQFTDTVREFMEENNISRKPGVENGVRETNGPPESGQKEITAGYGGERYVYNAMDQENKGQFRLYYLNTSKATALLQGAKVLMPKMPATHNGGYIHSITEPGSPVKMRISSVTESQQFKRWCNSNN